MRIGVLSGHFRARNKINSPLPRTRGRGQGEGARKRHFDRCSKRNPGIGWRARLFLIFPRDENNSKAQANRVLSGHSVCQAPIGLKDDKGRRRIGMFDTVFRCRLRRRCAKAAHAVNVNVGHHRRAIGNGPLRSRNSSCTARVACS